ncbi:MAG: dihydroorotate dehydrogenase electron transfer subunit [Actinomycetota bacterium]|nr:dihydroorotate dehydrogenase electron transfer subunit [Actinomycetota bacterium]
MIEIEAEIAERHSLFQGIFLIRLNAPQIAEIAKPGQFIHLQCGRGMSHILRRPFSIAGKSADGSIEIIFEVVGRGTAYLAKAPIGEALSVIGPLGNGFDSTKFKLVDIIAGGMGFPPLLFLANELADRGVNFNFFIGARTAGRIEFLAKSHLGRKFNLTEPRVATDDGSLGKRGTVLDLYHQSLNQRNKPEAIFACGPKPMLRSLSKLAEEHIINCFVSMEENMACGIGACLSCTCNETYGDKRVCVEGPVFDSGDIRWD